MKAIAISNRGAKKDFYDLYQILHNSETMQDLAKDLCIKYNNRDLSYVYLGMTYFEDAEDQELGKVFDKVSWNEIKEYFIANADSFLKALP